MSPEQLEVRALISGTRGVTRVKKVATTTMILERERREEMRARESLSKSPLARFHKKPEENPLKIGLETAKM